METPFSMIVAASSKSGKTRLVRDLILNNFLMFDKPVTEFVWLYHKSARDDKLFKELEGLPIRFIEGFPAEQIRENTLFNVDKPSLKCLIIDDLVTSALRSPVFIDLFTVISHHQNMIVIAILQNLHADTQSQRQIMNSIIRNVSYVVLFADRRQTSACKQIAKTYFCQEEHRLMEPYKFLINSKCKYDYMLIDFVGDNQIKFNCLRPDVSGFFFTFSS
jgi:hypothetical protein